MRRGFVVSVAALLLVGLSGCAADAPAETATPTPWPPQTTATTAETAMTDAEALEIGVATIEAYYLAASQVIDMGFDDGRLSGLAVAEWQQDVQEIAQSAAEEDWKVEGRTVFSNAELVSLSVVGGVHTIHIAVCADSTNLTAFRTDGTPSRPVGTVVRSSLDVVVTNSERADKVASIAPTNGNDRCA